jgi:serine/threonine protein kinase
LAILWFSSGDIKPGNFCLKTQGALLSSQPKAGAIKAIDFGCSQSVGGGVGEIGEEGGEGLQRGSRRLSKRSGTPAFMSPEIFNKVRY